MMKNMAPVVIMLVLTIANQQYCMHPQHLRLHVYPQPLCLICDAAANNLTTKIISHKPPENGLDPAHAKIYTGDVVLAFDCSSAGPQLAIAQKRLPSDQYVTLHWCHRHQEETVPIARVKILRFIQKIAWQPVPPVSFTREVCQFFLRNIKEHKEKPHIMAAIIPPDALIHAIGDLHGSIESLAADITAMYESGIINAHGKLQANHYLLVLGDVTDRGIHGGPTWCRLMELKIQNPDHVFFVRGNHETLQAAVTGDFFSQWQKYLAPVKADRGEQINLLQKFYASLPHAILFGMPHTPATSIVEQYKFLLFVHGGIDQTVNILRPILSTIAAYKKTNSHAPLTFPFSHGNPEISGLLWSDFHANTTIDQEPASALSLRGNGVYSYNSSAAWEYIERHYSDHPDHRFTLDGIIRAHQHIQGGIARLLPVKSASSPASNAAASNMSMSSSSGFPADFESLQCPSAEAVHIVRRPTVLSCTSSPEALYDHGCHEDAFVSLYSDGNYWYAKAHIEQRIPTHQ